MYNDGFNEMVLGTVTLAKELYDAGRYDIVERHFYDTICSDTYYENALSAIEAVFSFYYPGYNEQDESECLIFMDDVIGDYYVKAHEYGRQHNVPHDSNSYVKAAEYEVRRWLSFSYSLDWKLLGYTKTKATARRSRLIVYTCSYEFCDHDSLAYGLVMIHKWFTDKCAEFTNRTEVIAA